MTELLFIPTQATYGDTQAHNKPQSKIKLWLLKFLERFPQAQKNNFRAMCSINR